MKKGIGSGQPSAWLFARCTAGHGRSALLGVELPLASSAVAALRSVRHCSPHGHPWQGAVGTELSAERPVGREGGHLQLPMDNLSLEGNLKPSTHHIYHVICGGLALHLNR